MSKALENELLNVIADIKGNQEELREENERLVSLRNQMDETASAIEDIERIIDEQRDDMKRIIEELTDINMVDTLDQWGQPIL